MNTKNDITRFSPCDEGMEYYESKASFEEAWNDCEHSDWMLWIAAKLKINRRLLVKAAVLCANTVRHLMKDKRSTDAIDACLRYAAGEIDKSELENYAAAARDVAYAAGAAAYYSAEYAARAAYAAADSASASSAAARAASAADDTFSARTANICREVLTQAVMEKVKNY
jgi:hypothetical protein